MRRIVALIWAMDLFFEIWGVVNRNGKNYYPVRTRAPFPTSRFRGLVPDALYPKLLTRSVPARADDARRVAMERAHREVLRRAAVVEGLGWPKLAQGYVDFWMLIPTGQ